MARNYGALAEVLQETFRAAHPDIDFHVLVLTLDRGGADGLGLGDVITLGDLAIPREVLEPMLVMYGVTELATALKPFLLRHLLDRGYSSVGYLDPDIWVLAPFSEAFEAAEASTLALTPHTLEPVPRDGLQISERTIMQAGIFNLGFVAVSPGATHFLQWWQERLATDAVIDFENALFTDQRWVDWVPALFDHAVLKDPGLNVAYWNLHERPLGRAADGTLTVCGAPLKFVHFSGFDPEEPWRLSRFTGEAPRVVVGDDAELQELCRQYAGRLTAAGHAQRRREPYEFAALPGGPVLSIAIREVYRGALLGTEPFGPPPALPVSEPDQFRHWLTEPGPNGPWTGISPLEHALWKQNDAIRRIFPSPFGASSTRFRQWLDAYPVDVPEVHRRHGLAEPPRRPARTVGHEVTTPQAESRWSVVVGGTLEDPGDARAIGRSVFESLRAAGVAGALVTADSDRVATLWTTDRVAGSHSSRNVIVCVDAGNCSESQLTTLLGDHAGRCVALWLGTPPEAGRHRRLLPLFDEVWVVSDAAEQALGEELDRPVRRVRVHETLTTAASRGRPGAASVCGDGSAPAHDAGPLVLLEIDAGGAFEERVPTAIAAYRQAFDPSAGARLVVRAHPGAISRRQVEILQHAAGQRDDIVLHVSGEGPDDELAIPECADVVVSLHRNGGPVRSVLRALEAGVPVLAPDRLTADADDDGVAVAAAALVELAAGLPEARERALAVRERLWAGSMSVVDAVKAEPDEGALDAARLLRDAAASGVAGTGVVVALQDDVARLEAQLSALLATKTFRYTLALRRLYKVLRRGTVDRAAPGRGPSR